MPYVHTTTFLGWTALEWGDAFLYLGAFACVLFVVGYAVLAPDWKKSMGGWNVMLMGVCFALVLLQNSSATYLSDYYYNSIRPYTRLPIYMLTSGVLVQRGYWLAKVQLVPAIHTVLDKMRVRFGKKQDSTDYLDFDGDD